jgi:hypothetical protein
LPTLLLPEIHPSRTLQTALQPAHADAADSNEVDMTLLDDEVGKKHGSQ